MQNNEAKYPDLDLPFDFTRPHLTRRTKQCLINTPHIANFDHLINYGIM